MDPNLKVRRTAWLNLTQGDLKTFAGNVVAKTVNVAAYEPIRAQLAALQTANESYTRALEAALSRDVVAIATKQLTLALVYENLDEVAMGLENNANGDKLYILNAGMEVHRERGNHNKDDLPPPFRLTAESTGIPGEVLLMFLYPKLFRDQVETFCVEYSTDGGATWTNGTYGNKMRIKLRDLPSRQTILFRVRALGSFSRKSPWTQSEVGTYVL